ncbi:MAG: phenylacetate--CoA ligase [Oscillospiraceae bacterium]|nr:phenylacetate--CoA ligase [Oscillospiraceae bacterium]
MIWAKEETLSREEIERIQTERLVKLVHYVYDNVEPYRKKMDDAGIKPDDIKTLDDLKRLPFTTKQDFRDNYPFGLFAVDKSKLARIHASSGTTGKPTVVGYTKKDLETWAECVARLAVAGGAQADDVCQICFGYGMFTGALGLHKGLERVGACIIPSSTGNTEKQIMYMKDYGSTLLVATPSYALRIGEVATQLGLNPRTDLGLRTALVGSELMTEPMREEMKKLYGDKLCVTQNYGMSELMGPGISGECTELCGMHINEDHFICEIIDPETGEVLPAGEKGELVVTCLTKEALPLIRYRTRDITKIFYEPCKCGRTTARMDILDGRTDDMLKIRGVNVFPSQIEEVLLRTEEIGPHYEIIVDRKDHSDILTIKVELAPDKMTDDVAELEKIKAKLKSSLRTMLGLDAKIVLESPHTLKRFEGKAKRVTDNRKGLT